MSSNISSSTYMGAMTIGEIISRSWRLYRLNFNKIILYTLIPTAIFTLAQVLINIPPAFSDNPGFIGFSCCFLYPVGFSLLFLGLVFAVFFNACMIKAFYNRLIGDEFDYKYIFNYSKTNLIRLFKLCGLIAIEVFVFGIIDVFLIIFSYILFLFPIIISIGIFKSNHYLGGVIIGIAVLLLFLGLLLNSFVFMIQFFICSLQIITTIVESNPILECFTKSFSIAGKNITRGIGFLFSLFTLWYSLAFYFSVPATFLMMYIMYKSSGNTNGLFYILGIIIVTIWSYIVNMLIWPMIVSAITMYYYDYRVRTEGLDLILNISFEREVIKKDKVA